MYLPLTKSETKFLFSTIIASSIQIQHHSLHHSILTIDYLLNLSLTLISLHTFVMPLSWLNSSMDCHLEILANFPLVLHNHCQIIILISLIFGSAKCCLNRLLDQLRFKYHDHQLKNQLHDENSFSLFELVDNLDKIKDRFSFKLPKNDDVFL